MDRDELARQGKKMADDLRDTVSQKVSENQDTLKSTLGRAARWVDEKTGGKYSGQIDSARSKVDDGIGRVAAQGSPASGAPHAPGAAAGDPAPGPTPPTDPPTDPAGPVPPRPGPGRTEPMGPQTGRTEPMPPQAGPSYGGRTEPLTPQPGPPTDAPTTDAPRPTPPGTTAPGYTAPDPDAPRPPQV